MKERHALYVGWILGTALRNGVLARPVVDANDDYTDRLAIDLVDGTTIYVVVPEPPDDWELPS